MSLYAYMYLWHHNLPALRFEDYKMFNGPKMTNSEGEVPPPPLEVLIKSKWYRATAAVRDNHFGISLDEDQVSSMYIQGVPLARRQWFG